MEHTGTYHQCTNCNHITDYSDTHCPECGSQEEPDLSPVEVKQIAKELIQCRLLPLFFYCLICSYLHLKATEMRKLIFKVLIKYKIIIFKKVFTEAEKCLLNQALNLLSDSIKKDTISPDYLQDLNEIEELRDMCENKLWN